MNEDNVSRILKRALDVLFVSNPQGTALGVLIGLVIDTVINTLSPALPISIDKVFVQSWRFTTGLCSFGVVAMNVKPYIDRNKIDPKIMQQLQLIDTLEKEGKITKGQAKLEYVNLVKTITKNTVLNSKVTQQLEGLSVDE